MSDVDTGEAEPSGLSEHDTNDCSTKESGVDQPSPTQDACACVDAVCPSTPAESYASAKLCTSEDAAGGMLTG